jgi:hypothetical protein
MGPASKDGDRRERSGCGKASLQQPAGLLPPGKLLFVEIPDLEGNGPRILFESITKTPIVSAIGNRPQLGVTPLEAQERRGQNAGFDTPVQPK